VERPCPQFTGTRSSSPANTPRCRSGKAEPGSAKGGKTHDGVLPPFADRLAPVLRVDAGRNALAAARRSKLLVNGQHAALSRRKGRKSDHRKAARADIM